MLLEYAVVTLQESVDRQPAWTGEDYIADT